MDFIWTRCSQQNCVDVEPTTFGVRLTSTLGPDKGAVDYTHQEWAEFIAKVKAGDADGTVHPEFRETATAAV
jgi:hypothetical protein